MWFLVDSAEPDKGIRHVAKDGSARVRSLHRAIRPAALAAVAGSVVAQAIADRAPSSREVLVRGEPQRVLALPVPGPDGEPLAVRLWAGAAGAEPPEPPAVDAFVWDSHQWTLRSDGTGGPVLPAGHPLLHGAWFLSRIIECEDRDRLMAAALDPRPGPRWRGAMQVRTADGGTAGVYGFFRGDDRGLLRGLLIQVAADREPGPLPPTYRDDAAVALLGGTAALIDTRTMQIVEWLTPPLEGIAWRHHPASRGLDPSGEGREFNLATTHLVHPDDLAPYLAGLRELVDGRLDRARVAVRLLTLRREWRAVELHCVRMPGSAPRFLACLIRPLDQDALPG
ncbi:DUF5593 domain-containing protein [Nocardia puris]|uniref:GAF domain-containing protein n=1 Tax=Nocardia puris TaxID=208602 RepID=UPI0018948BA6|nr:GAF domain-containing protein [Nocardia puris]MBF6215286.1 DUF5593 domain-containing protein [Nocardia puris]